MSWKLKVFGATLSLFCFILAAESSRPRLPLKASLSRHLTLYIHYPCLNGNVWHNHEAKAHPTLLHMSFVTSAQRFWRVLLGNFAALVRRLEDPENVVQQCILEMATSSRRVRQGYAEIVASQRNLLRQRDEASETAFQWSKKAKMALSTGNEKLSREAIVRKIHAMAQVKQLEEQIRQQSSALLDLEDSIQALERKLSEAKSKASQLIARSRAVKTKQRIHDMLETVDSTASSFNALKRMQEKIEALEDSLEVSAEKQLKTRATLNEFERMQVEEDVEDELKLLKGVQAPFTNREVH